MAIYTVAEVPAPVPGGFRWEVTDGDGARMVRCELFRDAIAYAIVCALPDVDVPAALAALPATDDSGAPLPQYVPLPGSGGAVW